jgi:phosphoribosylformylglycinamidine synthase
MWLSNLSDLNTALQKGLSEQFDSTIGAGTVLMPFGGVNQLTPPDAMAAKLPADGHTETLTFMSYGFDPRVSRKSPFHGAVYAVTEALAKLVASGGHYKAARLSMQEYFERMTGREKWGKPLAALLGAFKAQLAFGVPAIGGKDSMSGTFKDLHVPPTLVVFALAPGRVSEVISPEFKRAGHTILLAKAVYDAYDLPNFEHLKKLFETVFELNRQGRIFAASAVSKGGLAASVSKMALGNGIGARLEAQSDLYGAEYGSLILETDLSAGETAPLGLTSVGHTINEAAIYVNDRGITLDKAEHALMSPLEGVFPTIRPDTGVINNEMPDLPAGVTGQTRARPPARVWARPRVLIPVFPGTNCEYDTARAFERAGGLTEQLIIRNLNRQWLKETIDHLAASVRNSQIIALPGGFSAGDEPDGSGKYIAAVFNNPQIKEAVNDLLKNRGGLMLGICNGFQALLKLGILTGGEISTLTEDSPALTVNTIGRHVSCMVRTRVVSCNSPWLWNTRPGDERIVPISHGEGRFAAPRGVLETLAANDQIATRYVDRNGKPSMDGRFNPNGSYWAIEGITSPDGRVFGKMGHSERVQEGLYKNIPGNKDSGIFEAGIGYFR